MILSENSVLYEKDFEFANYVDKLLEHTVNYANHVLNEILLKSKIVSRIYLGHYFIQNANNWSMNIYKNDFNIDLYKGAPFKFSILIIYFEDNLNVYLKYVRKSYWRCCKKEIQGNVFKDIV